ncbi:MAG TPA: GntR family transcriptional regulator, partial [Phycisphaeraceae bacterium]
MLKIDSSSHLPIYLQLEQQLADQILSRSLRPHEMIPSAVDLAQQLKISHLTVRRAYRSLTGRGLIYSIRGKGTFVADAVKQDLIAVAVSGEFFRKPDSSGVYAAVADALHQLGHRDGRLVKLLVCTTPYAQQLRGEFNEHDQMQFREAGLRGLFVSGVRLPPPVLEELRSRGVHIVAVPDTFADIPEHVGVDKKSLLTLPLQYARSHNRQRLGVIYLDLKDQPGLKHKIMESAQSHGFEVDRSRIIGVSIASMAAGQLACEYLLRAHPDVDCIVCYDDHLAQGVCTACIKQRQNVPDDILLIAHANKDITPPFLLPVAKVSVNVGYAVQMAYEKMHCLLNGKPCDHIPSLISPNMVPEDAPAASSSGAEIALN